MIFIGVHNPLQYCSYGKHVGALAKNVATLKSVAKTSPPSKERE